MRQRAWRAADDDLSRHVATCSACAEVAAVCEALADDLDGLRSALVPGSHPLPSAAQAWHRATLRARAEGLQSVSRSLVWAYGIAGAAVAGLTAALAGESWPMVASAFRQMAWRAPAPVVADGFGGWANAALLNAVPFALAVGVCLALAPLVVYLAVRDDQKL